MKNIVASNMGKLFGLFLMLSMMPLAGGLFAQGVPAQSPVPTPPGAERSRTYAFSPQSADGYAIQIGGGLGSFSVASSALNLQGSIGGQYHLSSWFSVAGSAGFTLGGYEANEAVAGLRSAIRSDTSQNGSDQNVVGYYLLGGPRFSVQQEETSWYFHPLIGVAGMTRFGFKLDDAGARKPTVVKDQHEYEPHFSASPALAYGCALGFERPLSGKWRWGLELRYLMISGMRYRSQNVEWPSAPQPAVPPLPNLDFGNRFNVSMVQLSLNFVFLDRPSTQDKFLQR